MRPTLALLVVGLTPRLMGAHTPNLESLARRGGRRKLATVLPSVTCSVQSTLLTGVLPSTHGIVANGWYVRDTAEVALWRQSNRLVGGEKIWETARQRDAAFTSAQMFWWYNMYASVDWSATPRPMYPADGRKIPDHYAEPPELHEELDAKFGRFPLFKFWGPMTDISATEWIAHATLHVLETRKPTLTLCYLPHLDYGLQRWGPNPEDPRVARDLREVDFVAGELIEAAERTGHRVVVVSEYGIVPVREAIHINRALRRAGLIRIRRELGRELLDAGASAAFALADHQIAHVYLKPNTDAAATKRLLESLDGVASVLDGAGKHEVGLDHPRSGELVALAAPDRWFSYYWWLDDDVAPDFARTVDIHRKPGYDPMELFFDPAIRLPKLRVAGRLAARALGQRNLMDLTPISGTSIVRGSHGLINQAEADCPVVISNEAALLPSGTVAATEFKALLLDHIFSA